MKEPLPVSVWEEGCAWRAGALEALGRDGRNYRIAYMSAHTAGQRAAIMADLAVAPLPKSFITGDMVELGPKNGMPVIGNYSLAMLTAPDAQPPVKAAADHIRATFETFRETGKF
jgi:DNA-binding transcriptional LysR family regulator